MCNCKKPSVSYIGKEILFKGEWYKCLTEDRMAGNIGIKYEGKLLYIRPSRIEGIR